MDKNDVMKKHVTDEMSKFKNFEALEEFVNTLQPAQICQLGQWLSSWRNNSVHGFICAGPAEWWVDKVHISKIKMTKINEKINPLLKEHGYLLEGISQDTQICNKFERQGEIKSRSLIAQKRGGKFEIIDGNHRAVRLACDCTKEFELIYRVLVDLRQLIVEGFKLAWGAVEKV